jgi:type I restriction enzyme S subunit
MNKDVMGVQEVSPGYEFVAENPAVPVGYKQTEMGVIPENWEGTLLEKVTTAVASGRSKSNQAYGSYPVYGSTGVIGYSSEPQYEGTAILVARVGANAGKLNKVSGKYGVTDNTIILRFSEAVETGFVWKSLELKRLNNLVFGSGQPLITGSQLKALTIAVPPLPEQRAIATALSDVDALLEELDRLIAKKRDIKQAAMQQLLTGETRLPGFEGEWEQVELGEVTDRCTSGATPYRGRPDFYKGNIRWVSSGELNYGVINDTNEHISLEAVRSANLTIHPAGTFLMAITGLEAAGTRGACGIVGKPSATNQSCMAIYPTKKLYTMYLFHYYVFRGDALAFKYCQGTKQQSYTAGLVKKLPISLPPSVEEQRAIAANLSDMDTEIQTLEQRRNKTAELKQGMMQELLTGRTRLV